jgi:glycosyltransferase involved in cell wall biosynthesis
MDQVLCESQALGIPAVTSRVNGNPECVAEGESALLCPVDDADAFAAALATLLGNAELRARFGAAARARALRVFAFERVAARLESEIYEPLARGEIPSPARSR